VLARFFGIDTDYRKRKGEKELNPSQSTYPERRNRPTIQSGNDGLWSKIMRSEKP